MTPDPEAKSIVERYDVAVSDEIVVDPGHRTSADYLIAAAWAQSSPRNRAAMALYRARMRICSPGVSTIRAWSVAGMVRQFRRGRDAMREGDAGDVFEIVLHWYLEGVCPCCMGRRFALVPGTQVVSSSACHVCDGRGREPVHHRLPRRHHEAGRWLADQFDDALSYVEGEMAKWLR